MSIKLDLADIQGNILTAYGKLGFPKGRHMLLHVDDAAAGRRFVTGLLPMITTALRWPSTRETIPAGSAAQMPRPAVTVNIAFSFAGLLALGTPTRTLRGMPDEFIDGMRQRASILGDDFAGLNWQNSWDEVWTASNSADRFDENAVHILIALNAQMNPDGTPVAALETATKEIEDLRTSVGKIRHLEGHNLPGRSPLKFQELTAIQTSAEDGTVRPLPTEHFGFVDAISDPVFEGQYPDRHEDDIKYGSGAVDGAGVWRPLATGEFLLGYPDEAQEIAGAAMPLDFSRNGTFMAYRKLYQNVAAFRTFIDDTAARFGAVFGIQDPVEAAETLKAKMAGRWPDGVPLSRAATYGDWQKFNVAFPDVSPTNSAGWKKRNRAIVDFTFGDDPEGIKCPLTSHLRRVNTRDGLAPTATGGSVLNNRRRIIRRGLPYGASPKEATDLDEHGIVLMVVCADLFRQFEFVQQQWIN